MKRFWDKVDKRKNCWIWTAGCDDYGYSMFWYEGRTTQGHRVAYELCIGPIPEGMCVLHHCDNPPCVNPAHLFLGTLADNHADMISKNRSAIRERHGSAKLTEVDVIAIRKDPGVSQRDLAIKYGVHWTTIWSVIHYKTWKEIGVSAS